MRIHYQLTILAGVAALLLPVAGQDFTIPSNWRKPTSNLGRQERLSLVNGLLNTVVRTLNNDNGLFNGLDTFQISESASMLSALSTSDSINGSTTNKDVVLKSLNIMFTNIPNITSSGNPIQETRDPATWGLAAITAYRTYKDPSALQYAQSMWKQLTAFMITPEDAAAGTHPMRSVNIPSACNFATTAGALFSSSSNSSNINVAGVAVTTFMALSAHLYEQTSDPQYMSAATLSADFIKSHLYNGVIIEDGVDLATCVTSNAPFTYDSGLTIDGLSSLAVFNSSYAPFLSSLISTVIPYPGWTNSSTGVINEGPSEEAAPTSSDFTSTLKAIFIRGLYQAYRRLPSNSSEAALIRSYITVQFNALLDLASTPGSNVYSPPWEGPPIPNLNPTGQLTAIDVLNSALGLVDDEEPPTSTASSGATSLPATATSSHDAPESAHHISPGVIGGIVAGVVMLLLVLVVLFVIVIHRRRSRRPDPPVDDDPPILDPYPNMKLLESGDSMAPPSLRHPKYLEANMQGSTSNSASSSSTMLLRPSGSGTGRTSPVATADVGGAGNPTGERHVVVNLASFERLVQRLDTVMTSGGSSQRTQEEHPPRYEA